MTGAATERARSVFVTVAAVLVAAALAHSGLLHRAQGAAPTGDFSVMDSSGLQPPPRSTTDPHRLLPVVTGPAGVGGYAFLTADHAVPVRFDPCQPIHFVISGLEPFAGANALLMSAVNEVSADTGLKFAFDGRTQELPAANRASYQPSLYGEKWAPVLVAWTNPGVVAQLTGNVTGLGGGQESLRDGEPRLVSGIVYLDGQQLGGALMTHIEGDRLVRAVMLHELGHLVGLAHTTDPADIMYPATGAVADYSAGDLRGLALAGAGSCFRTV